MTPRLQLDAFMGRWGNQCVQWAVARACADRFGATLELPPWEGDQIFDLNSTPKNGKLRVLSDDVLPTEPNVSIRGYFQYQQAFDLLSRSKVKQWMRVNPDLLALCPKPRPFYIACHVRRGDYVKHKDLFCIVEQPAFENAAQHYGYDLSDVIWLTEENPQPGSERLPAHIRFMYDFLTIMQADVIFRSNSTFSQWAAVLSDTDKVYSPLVGEKVGPHDDVVFIEGNHAANLSPTIHKTTPHSAMEMKP